MNECTKCTVKKGGPAKNGRWTADFSRLWNRKVSKQKNLAVTDFEIVIA
jgi:hypothetical protein